MNEFIPYGKQSLSDKDGEEVIKVLRSDWITTGPKVKEFELKTAAYCWSKFGIAVSSGTAALDLAVQVLNLPPKSEIITTPLTFIATINSILFNNHIPVLADIKPDTYNLDPNSVRQKITEKTRAIIYVNYAGQPCDIMELKKIAKEYGLYLIEDSAQALGAEYDGKKIGNFADLTVLSFHPVKHITTGEGGMILTDDEKFYHELYFLRNHGINKEVQDRFGSNTSWKYDIKYLARNYRITDFQCALGISQLRKSEKFLEQREKIAQKYNESLGEHPDITIPFTKPNIRHSWHLYPILIKNKDRDLVFRKLREKNIGVNVHHIPPYEFTYHSRFGWKKEDFPVTERIFHNTLTLPIYPGLTEGEQDYIIHSLLDVLKGVENEPK